MTHNYRTIQLEVSERIATLTVNRPEVRNALSKETVQEMHAALRELAARDDVGVVILDKSFVAGADIREIRKRGKREALEAINQELFSAVENFPWPVIAAVNGYALGGGFELALACDIRVAAESARFGFPETGLGIIPAAGGTQRLPRHVGWGRAKEIILTGRTLDAQEAEQLGLVSKVAPADELMATASELAGKILSRGPLAVVLFESEDKKEGTTAFLEKRKPKFRGE
jgi:enoyl-CoA hydratase